MKLHIKREDRQMDKLAVLMAEVAKVLSDKEPVSYTHLTLPTIYSV